MKRPFLVIGASALVASYFALAQNVYVAVVILCFIGFSAVVLTYKGRETLLKAVMVGAIFTLLAIRFLSVAHEIDNNSKELIGKTVQAGGIVTEIGYKSDKFSVCTVKILNSDTVSAKGITTQVLMGEYCGFSVGDKIIAQLDFEATDEKYKAKSYSAGTYYSCQMKEYSISAKKPVTVYSIGEKARNLIKSALLSVGADEETAVLRALIIGDDSDISEELNTNVKNSGVSHMLVVSGMHLGIICGAIFSLMNAGILGKRITVMISVITVIFLLIVCFFHISIFRAGISYVIMLLGLLISKNADGLNSLGFAAFVLTLVYPYLFYNVAFLLSGAATFAVLYPSNKFISLLDLGRFKKPLQKLIYAACSTVIISACATVCTLPITVKYFGNFSVIAPITNLLVSYAVSAALVLGVGATVLYFIPILGQPLSVIPYYIAKYCCKFFVWVVDGIGSSRIGTSEASKDDYIYFVIFAVLFVAAVDVFYYFIKKRKDDGDAQRQNA